MKSLSSKPPITLDMFRKDPQLMWDFIEFYFGLRMHNYQKNFLMKCLTKNRIAGKWPRQRGKSEAVAIYCCIRCLFEPTTILITATGLT